MSRVAWPAYLRRVVYLNGLFAGAFGLVFFCFAPSVAVFLGFRFNESAEITGLGIILVLSATYQLISSTAEMNTPRLVSLSSRVTLTLDLFCATMGSWLAFNQRHPSSLSGSWPIVGFALVMMTFAVLLYGGLRLKEQ